MDKNVSGVDLDELLKAREELNKEIGVETDPNMYSDYNPNRKNEDSQESSSDETEETLSSEKSDADFSSSESENLNEDSEETPKSEAHDEPKFEDGYSEQSKEKEEVSESHSSASDNLQKYDIFSAFEVKENVHESAGDKLDFDKLEDSSQRTTNLDKLEAELAKTSDDENDLDSENSDDSKFETIDNVEELEMLLDKLLEELDSDDEEPVNKAEETIENEEIHETIQNEAVEDSSDETNEESSELEEKTEDLATSYLTSLDIEPKFDEDVSETSETETETSEAEDETPAKSDRLDLFMKGSLGASQLSEETQNSEISEENTEDSEFSQKFDDFAIENLVAEDLQDSSQEEMVSDEDVNLENEVSGESEPESIETENVEETRAESTENQEEDENIEESEEKVEIEEEDDDSYLEALKSAEPVQEKQESVALESYNATKASPPQFKKTGFENELSDDDTEIITDYNQLREILQRELKESEEASQEKVEEEDDGVKYEIIEEFKFLDEIATDEFKNSDKFSYIMGKNEKGEMVYGNFREHFNLAVFGKNDLVMNSFLNSMVLSLCLKNSTSEVNFVMLDSNINSTFEVYNKSSYLFFNRIAKTNKEILDTLIEITKEIDERYNRLAEAGMSNAEQFNDMARETETSPMTQLIVVFNNYTDASQATYVDKINACLYQVLKFGRLVGVYAVVTAMLPISTNQVNYNLSSRLSFKSDDNSKYTVGAEGTHKLPDESDAIYFNITKNTTEHIKTATVTDTELDLIIKELEE